MSSKNNNQLNIPEARQAMDQFKMEAARDFGVLSTSKSRAAKNYRLTACDISRVVSSVISPMNL